MLDMHDDASFEQAYATLERRLAPDTAGRAWRRWATASNC